jgi:Pentapeptide repeats (8 copies)
MANQEHLELLRESAAANNEMAAWNRWRSENRDIRPDLSAADLSGADLSGAKLGGADLRSADLRSADLTWVRGIHLLSARHLAQLAALALAASLALLLWTLLDLTIHWTTAFPWLGGGIGVLMATGAILFLLLGRPTQNDPWAVRPLIRNGILALFPFIAGVSHIYQSLYLWYGGFSGAGGEYVSWLAYQLGWVVDILLFNVFDVYAIPVSPIRPQALWAQTVVFALNLLLVAIVLGATFNAYNEFQIWRRRIKGDL